MSKLCPCGNSAVTGKKGRQSHLRSEANPICRPCYRARSIKEWKAEEKTIADKNHELLVRDYNGVSPCCFVKNFKGVHDLAHKRLKEKKMLDAREKQAELRKKRDCPMCGSPTDANRLPKNKRKQLENAIEGVKVCPPCFKTAKEQC